MTVSIDWVTALSVPGAAPSGLLLKLNAAAFQPPEGVNPPAPALWPFVSQYTVVGGAANIARLLPTARSLPSEGTLSRPAVGLATDIVVEPPPSRLIACVTP